jgi:hypothetical protein
MRSINIDCQRSVNFYVDVDELGTGGEGEKLSLIGTPGLTAPLVTLPTSPIRAIYTATNGTLYACAGNTLYMVTLTLGVWAYTVVGTIASSNGTVSMVDNGIAIMLVDGTDGWYSTLGSTTLTKIVDPLWAGANQVILADGFFVFNQPNSFEFYFSQSLSTTLIQNGLGFLSKNTPDKLVGMVWDKRNLWLFGEQEVELWYNAGSAAFGISGAPPFQIVQGTYPQIGCAARFSIQEVDNTIIWLGRDKNGNGQVFAMNGYQPQRISTFPVEYAISTYGDLSQATAWVYQEAGHNFYCLNIPGAPTTWVFDTKTGFWHERCYLNSGVLERHRAENHSFAYNTSIVGDYQSGNLYQLSSSVYTDNGVPIVSRRTSPHIEKDMDRIFYSQFQIDFEPGVGLDGIGQGTDPIVILRYSDDNGHTWSNEKWATMGKIGHTKHRVQWQRLGRSRSRVFEITITDPVKRILIGADINASQGTS